MYGIQVHSYRWWLNGNRQTAIIRFSLNRSLVNKSPHVLIVSKTNVHDNDACPINFSAYLFLCKIFVDSANLENYQIMVLDGGLS